MENPPAHPTFREAFMFWLRLGFISFGGPAGQIAIMHDFLVEKKRWISESKFLHALNYCMLLPGPEAQQLAVYTGWLLHGTRGGLAAGVLFVLPSAFILWGLSALYVTYGHLEAVQALFSGLKPAVLAIVVGAVWKIGKKSLSTYLHWGVAAVAFVSIYFFKIPFPLIILGAIAIGFAVHFWGNTNAHAGAKNAAQIAAAEDGYVINAHTERRDIGFSAARLLRQLATTAVLGILPLVFLWMWGDGFDFWQKLIVFFTKAAFVTFGGAYAVLPYVAQVSVEKFHWLTNLQMVDGLALGETTPGPLIIVLAFVGFMAGYNTFGGSLWAATFGLAATVYYTFLPSFLFIFVGAPIIERTQTNPMVKAVLQYATAAVTGVVLNLCLYFGQAVIMPVPPEVHWWPLAWAVISWVAMQRLGVGMMLWIGVSALAGLVFRF